MSIRHVVHDSDRCRLVVEVDVGIVTLSLFFGSASTTGPLGFSSHASVHLSPTDARDRGMLNLTVQGLERVAGVCARVPGTTRVDGVIDTVLERRVPLDVLHRSVLDITRRPTA